MMVDFSFAHLYFISTDAIYFMRFITSAIDCNHLENGAPFLVPFGRRLGLFALGVGLG